MELLQTFESTVTSNESEYLVFHSVFVPLADVPAQDALEQRIVAELLGADSWSPAAPDEIPLFIALMIEQGVFAAAGVSTDGGLTIKKGRPIDAEVQDPRSLDFAKQVFEDSVIPITQSPLGLESLARLVKLSTVGMGAAVGYMVVAYTPLLLITIPAGIIICGAAAGIGKALEEGLRKRMLDLLRKRPERKKKGDEHDDSLGES
jgi:hypothetical protein